MRRRTLTLGAALLAVATVPVVATPAVAQTTSLVITEIMYNPASDDDDHEFIEIHNRGSAPADLVGLTFTEGIEATIASGSLAPGAYAILSPDPAVAQSVYGVAAVGTYSGKLSNGGETVTLTDAAGTVIDTVTYDDSGSWPSAPDGTGASLALTDPAADNANPVNWSSQSAPTPAAANAAPTAGASFGDIVVTPPWPTAAQDVSVAVEINGAAAADLRYRVMFGAEQTAPMTRSGNTFSAVIPAQAAGSLIRYRITTDVGSTLPTADDSIDDLGIVVQNPVTTNLPVMEWFITDEDYAALNSEESRTGPEELRFPATLAYNGEVHTGLEVSIRGGGYARANFAKQSIDIDFPSGHTMDAPELFDYPVNEFALKSDFSIARGLAAWDVFEQAGFWKYHTFNVRLQKNGVFHAQYRVKEKLDGTWRDRNDIDGQFYKADGGFKYGGWGKKQPDGDDTSAPEDLARFLRSQPSADELWDVFDIPNLVNYWAASAVTRHQDQDHHNKYVHFDDNDTELWSLVPWDLDHTFGPDGNEPCTGEAMITLECLAHPVYDAMWRHEDFRTMYFRRIRSLLDGPMAAPRLEDLYAATREALSADAELEARAWGSPDGGADDFAFLQRVADQRSKFAGEPRVPGSQASAAGVVINEIHYDPAGDRPEFVELLNTTDQWLDVSLVDVEGIGTTIPGGTVIAPGGYLVLTDKLRDFRDLHDPGSAYLVVKFDGGLKSGGELLRLNAPDGTVLDEVTYSSEPPWETYPAGSGFSLELSDPAADNALPESWFASTERNGTPGRANSEGQRTDPANPPVDPEAPIIDNAQSLAEIQAADDYREEEHQNVLRLYRAFFNRDPDVAGARYWISEIYDGRGASLDAIAAQFAASQEFQNTYGSVDNRGYLDILYRNVLLREPDQAGLEYWLGFLDRGELDRGSVVRWVAAGIEFESRVSYPKL